MKDEFVLSIEESLISIKEHGIIVMVNSKNEKLYVKPISHENGFIELKILSMKELSELGITIQESCINSDFDIYEVQESEHLPSGEELAERFDAEKRKRNLIPLNTVEDAEKMKEIAEKAKEILARKGADPEELKAENEDLRLKLEIIATRELENRIKRLKITDPEMIAKIHENPNLIQGYEMAIKDLIGRDPIPEGSAPLNYQQMHGNTSQGFENVEAMIKDLRQRAKSFVPYEAEQAQKILDALFKKTVQGMKQRNSVELPFENADKQPIERSSATEIEVNIHAPKDPNQESELKKFGIGVPKKKRDDQ